MVATAQIANGAITCGQVASSVIPGINYGLASGLPGKCGVNVGYPISPSVDCNT
ncbi:Non-specific lipid-transfer protein [Linum perenne]